MTKSGQRRFFYLIFHRHGYMEKIGYSYIWVGHTPYVSVASVFHLKLSRGRSCRENIQNKKIPGSHPNLVNCIKKGHVTDTSFSSTNYINSKVSGCVTVGRVVASDTRDPRFESQHWQKFICP